MLTGKASRSIDRSPPSASAVAVHDCSPPALVRQTIWTDRDSPGPRLPSGNSTFDPRGWSRPADRSAATRTFSHGPSPGLVTVRVYAAGSPTSTLSGPTALTASFG